MPSPDQDARHDYNPQSKVRRLSDRDGTRLAIPEEPVQNSANHRKGVSLNKSGHFHFRTWRDV
jgi:hypothetical protein